MPHRGHGVGPALPQLLLERARGLDPTVARTRLDALLCCDAARWAAWPAELPEAVAAEQRLLALPPLDTTSQAGRLLAETSDLRRALHAATPEAGYDAAAEAIAALPPGYPVKSTWLHWRDLLLATARVAQWNEVRRRLAADLQRHGVPPSETRAALLGRLDLQRWRAEGRLLATAREALNEVLPQAPAVFLSHSPRVLYEAAAGHALVLLEDADAGAALLHRATEDLPLAVAPRAARLYSRPAPEAAVWLRRAIDRAGLLDHEVRDGLLHHAILALLALAARHRAQHVLREALEPLPVRYVRPDVTACLLTAGAVAWHACGDTWLGFEWFAGGMRLAMRFPRNPLIPDAAGHAVTWVERTRDSASFEHLRDLVQRLSGPAQLSLRAELARLYAGLGDRERGWEQLTAAYRLAQPLRLEAQATVLVAVADTLLAWDHPLMAYDLMARALRGNAAPGRLPASLATAPGDPQAEGRLIEALAGEEPARFEAAAQVTGTLLRRGATALAAPAHDAARRAVGALADPHQRLRAAVTLARTVGTAADVDLRLAVETAVADEAALVLERLRIDDPPRTRGEGLGARG